MIDNNRRWSVTTYWFYRWSNTHSTPNFGILFDHFRFVRSFRLLFDHFDYRSITIRSYKDYWLFRLPFDYHSSTVWLPLSDNRAEIFSFIRRKNVVLWGPPAHRKSPVFSGAAKKTPFSHRKVPVLFRYFRCTKSGVLIFFRLIISFVLGTLGDISKT